MVCGHIACARTFQSTSCVEIHIYCNSREHAGLLTDATVRCVLGYAEFKHGVESRAERVIHEHLA
jgi:hypothetical protein